MLTIEDESTGDTVYVGYSEQEMAEREAHAALFELTWIWRRRNGRRCNQTISGGFSLADLSRSRGQNQ